MEANKTLESTLLKLTLHNLCSILFLNKALYLIFVFKIIDDRIKALK